jgi:L-threonylcarbamoyladenylate synthase
MLPRHYAPRTPLELVPGTGRARVEELAAQGRCIGWLALGEPGFVPAGVTLRVLPPDPAGYAAGLYAALHELDALGLDRIVADLPPEEPAWLAVHDRLRRASA